MASASVPSQRLKTAILSQRYWNRATEVLAFCSIQICTKLDDAYPQ